MIFVNRILKFIIVATCFFTGCKANSGQEASSSEFLRQISIVESYHYSKNKDSSNSGAFVGAILCLSEETGIPSLAQINWWIGYPNDSSFHVDIANWKKWYKENASSYQGATP